MQINQHAAIEALLRFAPVYAPALALSLLAWLRHRKRRWPDLWRVRRGLLPLIERVDQHIVQRLPPIYRFDPKLLGEIRRSEYAGHVDASPDEIRQRLRQNPDVFPRNLAMQKYVVRDGTRVYTIGSYAHLENGVTGKYQTHIRLVLAPEGGTDVYAHHELSPWRYPLRHYRGHGQDDAEGVRVARELLDIRPPAVGVA